MRRCLLVLPTLALVVPGLTGCGEDEASASELIRSAPAALEEAGSMRMAMTMEVAGEQIEAEGAFDIETESGYMEMDLPEPVGGSMESVFEGTTVYMRSDLFGAELPPGVEWLRIDYDELLESEAGIDLSQLTQGSNNPADALSGLQAISEDEVEEIGPEEIRGVETTGYRASIDIEAAYEELDGVIDDEQFEQFTAVYGDEPLDIEVWLDDEGLARRQVMTFEIQGQEVEQSMEFFDFGDPVDVEVPDESDTVDLLDLLPEF